jgi:hypothetical protein
MRVRPERGDEGIDAGPLQAKCGRRLIDQPRIGPTQGDEGSDDGFAPPRNVPIRF